VRRGPKVTFTLGAQRVDEDLLAQLGVPSLSELDTERAASLFEVELRSQDEDGELISKLEREAGGIAGVEYIYRAMRPNGTFYYATWLAVNEGVLYELKSWANARRISRTRFEWQFHQLQEHFERLAAPPD
jgi:hypothetical protein